MNAPATATRKEIPSIPGMWPYDADIAGDTGEGTPRGRTLSIFWAAQASTLLAVQQFRQDHLDGKLLAPGEVEAWVTTRPENLSDNGRAALWLCNIPRERLIAVADGSAIIPAKLMAEALDPRTKDVDAPRAEKRYLVYATPAHTDASEVIRVAGGVLDSLRTLAHELVHNYHVGTKRLWTEAHAATFVLTGYAPLLDEHDFPPPTGSGRRQTEKHLQLVAFNAPREAAGMSPAARLAEWNARYPHWRYKNTSNFGWDSREAERRLMESNNRSSQEPNAGAHADDVRRAAGYLAKTGEDATSWRADAPTVLDPDTRLLAERNARALGVPVEEVLAALNEQALTQHKRGLRGKRTREE